MLPRRLQAAQSTPAGELAGRPAERISWWQRTPVIVGVVGLLVVLSLYLIRVGVFQESTATKVELEQARAALVDAEKAVDARLDLLEVRVAEERAGVAERLKSIDDQLDRIERKLDRVTTP